MKNAIKTMMAMATVSALALPAYAAGTDDANLEVKATVVENCLIETAELNFGDYDPVGANKNDPLDGEGSVTVTCTQGAPIVITLDGGANEDGASTTDPKRQMTDGTNNLAYNLYSDPGRTIVWAADETAGVDSFGTGVADVLTVHGRVLQDQNVAAGDYTDTVVATVSF